MTGIDWEIEIKEAEQRGFRAGLLAAVQFLIHDRCEEHEAAQLTGIETDRSAIAPWIDKVRAEWPPKAWADYE